MNSAGEGSREALEPGPVERNLTRSLGPGRKRDRKTRHTCIMTPVDDGADIAPTLTTEMVCPNRSSASKRVCMRVMPTVDHLPLQVPTAIRRLSKPKIDVSALFGQPEPRLSRSVPNDRDAIADDTSAKRTTMSVPVFACKGGKKREGQAACVGLRDYRGIASRGRHDRPRNARRRAAAVYIPE